MERNPRRKRGGYATLGHCASHAPHGKGILDGKEGGMLPNRTLAPLVRLGKESSTEKRGVCYQRQLLLTREIGKESSTEKRGVFYNGLGLPTAALRKGILDGKERGMLQKREYS